MGELERPAPTRPLSRTRSDAQARAHTHPDRRRRRDHRLRNLKPLPTRHHQQVDVDGDQHRELAGRQPGAEPRRTTRTPTASSGKPDTRESAEHPRGRDHAVRGPVHELDVADARRPSARARPAERRGRPPLRTKSRGGRHRRQHDRAEPRLQQRADHQHRPQPDQPQPVGCGHARADRRQQPIRRTASLLPRHPRRARATQERAAGRYRHGYPSSSRTRIQPARLRRPRANACRA